MLDAKQPAACLSAKPCNRFTWRATLRGDAEIDAAAASIAFVLYSYMDSEGKCYPSKETIAHDARFTVRTADRAVNRLVAAGFLVVTRSVGGASNRYQAATPTPSPGTGSDDLKPRHQVRGWEPSTPYATTPNPVPDDSEPRTPRCPTPSPGTGEVEEGEEQRAVEAAEPTPATAKRSPLTEEERANLDPADPIHLLILSLSDADAGTEGVLRSHRHVPVSEWHAIRGRVIEAKGGVRLAVHLAQKADRGEPIFDLYAAGTQLVQHRPETTAPRDPLDRLMNEIRNLATNLDREDVVAFLVSHEERHGVLDVARRAWVISEWERFNDPEPGLSEDTEPRGAV